MEVRRVVPEVLLGPRSPVKSAPKQGEGSARLASDRNTTTRKPT